MNRTTRSAMTCLLACQWLVATPGDAQQGAAGLVSLEVIEPRAFGYTIGDVLERRIELGLAAGYRLDAGSLPPAGRLDRWLELDPPGLAQLRSAAGPRYRIDLRYRIFDVPPPGGRVLVPAPTLRLTGPDGDRSVDIPAFGFTMSAVRIVPAGAGISDLQRAVLPEFEPTRPLWQRLSLAALVLAAAMLWLVHAYWGLPFAARRHRPFADAWRALRRLERDARRAERYPAALRLMHVAINATAGRAVFADELDEFFRRCPQFAPRRAAIEQMFACSRRAFFDADQTAVSRSLGELLALCRDCRRLERAT